MEINTNKIEDAARLGIKHAKETLEKMQFSFAFKPTELSEEQKDCLDILGKTYVGVIIAENESFPKGTLVELYGEPIGSESGGNFLAKAGDMFAIVLGDSVSKFNW